MRRSLLLKALGTLKKKERQRFTAFLSSSYLNQGSNAEKSLQLWECIEKGWKKKAPDLLDKSNVYQQLYPGEKIFKGKLEKLMSYLLQLLHRFLVMEGAKTTTSELYFQRELYKAYLDRGLETEARIRMNAQLKGLENEKTTSDNLLGKFSFTQSIIDYNSLKNNRREDLQLPFLIEQLDEFHLFTKLEYCLQMLAIDQWIVPVDFGEGLKRLEISLKLVPRTLRVNPVFCLYEQAFQLLKDFKWGDAELFNSFLDFLEKNQKECTEHQLKIFQTLARTYCNHFYHKGKDEFIKLGYQLYRKHLAEGLLYHHDKILVGAFRNIVLLGIWNNELDWVAEFMEEHKDKLTGADNIELVYNLHLATLTFYQKSYDQALDLLTMNFDDQYLKLAARRLEIMIFYEMNSPVFLSKLEAFKVFVFRISDEDYLKKTKDRNRNFVDLLKQIQHPKTLGNATRIDKLSRKIKVTTYVAEKPWLQQKLMTRKKL